MQLPNQIEAISIARAANAAHYEYLATVAFYTNAYFALNPDRCEAADLVKRMSEDLDYFRKHAMSDPHKSKKEPQPDGGDAPADTVAAEA